MSNKKKQNCPLSLEQKMQLAQEQHKEKSKLENACVPIELKTHEQYLEYLKLIEKDCSKIIIVQIDGEDESDPVIYYAKKKMRLESRKRVIEWFGSIAPNSKALEYTFANSNAFFDYLRTFEAFYIEISDNPFDIHRTDFGIDDIAFIGKKGDLLLYTTTHEGYAYLNEKYM